MPYRTRHSVGEGIKRKGIMIKDDDIEILDMDDLKSDKSDGSLRESKKGGKYAESYAASESNVAEMLAEYDSIGNTEARPVKRSEKSSTKASKKSAASKRGKKKTSKPAAAKKKSSAGRYADAMYESPAECAKPVKCAQPAQPTKSAQRAKRMKPAKSTDQTKRGQYGAEGASRAGKSSAKQKQPAFFNKLSAWFKGLTGLDYLVAGTGVAVLVVAVITVNIFSNAKARDERIKEFAAIGDDLSLIGTAGEGVLVATADNKSIVITEDAESIVLTEYNEKEDESTGTVTVTMNLQSVVKDLKIKFVNKSTNKLIAGIPFEAEVTDANKKTTTYTDEDKDGVIYINPMQHGDTKVKLKKLDGYDGYDFAEDTQSINVKETLEYKKIDVSDEIKKESQVNAAIEDTGQKEQVEAVLTDTVEWVESTKTATGTTTVYTAVSASEIAKPTAISGIDILDRLYYKLLEMTEHTWVNRALAAADGDTSEPTEEPTPEPTAEPTEEPTPEPTAEPTDEVTPAPTASPTETPAVEPTPTVAATPTTGATPTTAATPSYNTSASLKTTGGAQLYIRSGDSYKAATAGDYLSNPGQTFYKQSTEASGYSYTGWQTIDGSTYFFDKNGNKVTGDQVIQGAKYSFNSDGVLQAGSGNLGIDVSKFNGNIDWTKVRNSGISYVIIRCGYRGSTSGGLIEDPKFRENIKGATAAGLKVGVYFFTQATNEVEAVEEASMTLNLISGYKISYPVFLDVEGSGGRGDRIDYNTRTAVINAFCKTISNSGYSSGVYASKSWLTGKFNPGGLGNAKIWLAQYNTTPTYSGRYNLWQYSSKGSVNGISGYVDMDLSYLGY